MKDIINWIIENKRIIFECFLCLLSLIILCIRKKPNKVIDTLKEIILKNLPDYINKAESKGFSGQHKLEYVLELMKVFFEINGFEFTDYYKDFVIKETENILSTPQKKEGKK